MHNNFLIDRGGKMSKSTGEFLRLQVLVERGFHPLAYRLMCLQAHYRSELEFSWDNLAAALTRLKRMVMGVANVRASASMAEGVEHPKLVELLAQFDAAVSEDLNTAVALTCLDEAIAMKKVDAGQKLAAIAWMDNVLGFGLMTLDRSNLRVRPKAVDIDEPEIEDTLTRRKQARVDKDFATSDALRDELIAKGIEVMDGDPLGWDWKLEI
jgi:cysteinyl-tRNA synthetase